MLELGFEARWSDFGSVLLVITAYGFSYCSNDWYKGICKEFNVLTEAQEGSFLMANSGLELY